MVLRQAGSAAGWSRAPRRVLMTPGRALIWVGPACPQNANRRPNTYKLLLLPSIRSKAEELGISLPDQASLALMADRNMAQGPATKVGSRVAAASRERARPPAVRLIYASCEY